MQVNVFVLTVSVTQFSRAKLHIRPTAIDFPFGRCGYLLLAKSFDISPVLPFFIKYFCLFVFLFVLRIEHGSHLFNSCFLNCTLNQCRSISL